VSDLVTIHPEPCSLLSYNTVSSLRDEVDVRDD
jgi:hypothetical protein